jgi:hypothetical protein
MAYSDFSLAKVKKEFGLIEEKIQLFPELKVIEPSEWLKTTLNFSLRLALASSSEKARSEFIVAPLLLELEMINNQSFSIFSGERLDVLPEQGLNGECDFILSKNALSSTLQTPIFCLVEAKKNDIKEGLGQCVAQMLGATLFNQNEGLEYPVVYGCVTTGEIWQFLKLKDKTFYLDSQHYYINEVAKLIGILQAILDEE